MKDKIKEIIESIYAIGFSDGFLGEKYHKPKIYFHSDKLVALFQAHREEDIKAFEEMLKDEDNYGAGIREGKFTGYIKETGEEIPLRMINQEDDKNSLRAELRTKLDQYKKENI